MMLRKISRSRLVGAVAGRKCQISSHRGESWARKLELSRSELLLLAAGGQLLQQRPRLLPSTAVSVQPEQKLRSTTAIELSAVLCGQRSGGRRVGGLVGRVGE